MKALLVGIGSFGLGWYRTLKAYQPHLDLVVVDRDPRMAERLSEPCEPFYTDFAAALDQEHPDFVVNLTPPAVHTRLNHQAFDRRIAVLCEKPIAEEYGEAVDIVQRAQREGLLFMIAENYRRWPVFRLARRLIEQGEIGQISAITVNFYKEAYFEKEYLLQMPDPLLQDVSVHHLDLVRYLTGSEGRRMWAYGFNPTGSRYPGRAALNFVLEMQDGCRVSYLGSLAARAHETGWGGEWRVEGTRAVLLVAEDVRLALPGGEALPCSPPDGLDTSSCLDEFLNALAQVREPETSGRDYLRTQHLVHSARLSLQQGGWVNLAEET